MANITAWKLTGDYQKLMNDINRSRDEFEDLNLYEFGKLNDEIAEAYKNELNHQLPDKLKLAKKDKSSRSGKVITSSVRVPQEVIDYDIADGVRVLNINTSKNLQDWVKRKWNPPVKGLYNSVTKKHYYRGWRSTAKDFGAKLSTVYGSEERPRGFIYARSRKANGRTSFIEKTNDFIKSYQKQKLEEKAPIIFKRVGQRLFGKKIYKININVSLKKKNK